MTDEVWRLKVHAFLHDPPEKALILFDRDHAARGRELAERLVESPPKGAEAAIQAADQMASAADRERFLRDAQLRWRDQPLLRHPLSGDKIDLRQWGHIGVEPDDVVAEVDYAVERLRGALGNGEGEGLTPERVFWGLWRLLPEYLAGAGSEGTGIGTLWHHLPADTRMPDHSIWDHQRLVSALAPILWRRLEPALLLFSFGPVQRFIGTARRTADLWAGSYILSWLASRAILPLVQAYGPDVVFFPSLWKQPLLDQCLQEGPLRLPVQDRRQADRASLPNRFLAVVPGEDAKDIAERCVEALQVEWRDLGKKTSAEFAELTGMASENFMSLFDRQLPAHIETYWAVFPWPQELDQCRKLLEARLREGGLLKLETVDLDGIRQYQPSPGALYGMIYRAVDLTLGGAKAARIFVSDEEPGLKCSLCGDREVVHPETQVELQRIKRWWQGRSEQPHRFRKGEALCAVCLVKRLGHDIFPVDRRDVPSTSEIAAAPFKLAVLDPDNFSKLREPVAKLVEAAHSANRDNSETLPLVWRAARRFEGHDGELARSFSRIDGECFWATLEPEEEAEGAAVPQQMADAARALVKAAGHIPQPFPYLAILRMDGDDMGKWLGGDRAVTLAETLHPEAEGWLRDSMKSVELLLGRERRMTPATHAAISRACGAFALSVVPALVGRYLAYLIYAGGDDLLVLVSLDHAMELARELRLAFGGHMAIEGGQEVKEFGKGHGFYQVAGEVVQTFGRRAGLSGGLVVFHHKYPLQVAVEESRLALEERAKKPPKDMLALSIIRRSGQPTRCRLRWKNEVGTLDAVEDLSRASEVFEKGLLSPRFFSSLTELLRRPEARAGRLPSQALHDLMQRELERHWKKDEAKRAGLTDEEVEKARKDVGAAIWRLRDQIPDKDQEAWLATLEAAVFLARGGR